MVYSIKTYIDKKYKPTAKDLVVEYYAEPEKGVSMDKLCNHLACESSIGTWTTISTMNPKIARDLRPSVYYINPKTHIIKIAYNQELFEPGNMAGIWSSIAGNVFGMKAVKNLRLMDISFPKKILDAFDGPQHGIAGLRKRAKIPKRPFVGTIVKPKVGLTAKQHAKVAYDAWVGGLDAVKDDENLVSMSFNKVAERFRLTHKMKDKAERETGEKKFYFANVTAESLEMLKRADMIRNNGGDYIMIDILTSGWSGLQTIRNYAKKHNMFIHAHRAMHAALTKNPKHGISMLTIAKCARLIGIDTLHIGTAGVGKMIGNKQHELDIEDEIEHPNIREKDNHHLLKQNWRKIKPVMAVASGGLSSITLDKVMKIMGNDVTMQAGGGCHGHPDGTVAGAAAMRQAVDATMKKIPLRRYAKTHKELERAFEKWG